MHVHSVCANYLWKVLPWNVSWASRLTGNRKNTNQKTSVSTLLSLSAEPDGPPMDVILQPVTSQSIRVTWKVK